MIITILFLAVLFIAAILVIKNTSLKKGKDIFSIYDNSFFYRFIGFVVVVIISFIIYLFNRPH
jgi:uncharacterized protein HemY